MTLYYFWKYYKGEKFEAKEKQTHYCCEQMELAFKENFIGFGDYDSMVNKDLNVNIYKCFIFPEGASHDSMKLNNCPFCGNTIKTLEFDSI